MIAEILKAVSLLLIIFVDITISSETAGTSTATSSESVDNDDIEMGVKEALVIDVIRGRRLRYDEEHGIFFHMNESLYNKARKRMGQIGENFKLILPDRVPKYDRIAPYSLDFDEDKGNPQELNLVFCRGNPIDFYVFKENKKKYMIYYHNIE